MSRDRALGAGQVEQGHDKAAGREPEMAEPERPVAAWENWQAWVGRFAVYSDAAECPGAAAQQDVLAAGRPTAAGRPVDAAQWVRRGSSRGQEAWAQVGEARGAFQELQKHSAPLSGCPVPRREWVVELSPKAPRGAIEQAMAEPRIPQ